MTDNSFFDESTEQSLVKAEIVAKYFWAWAKVIMSKAKKRGQKIAYVDLFSGPGRYKDGSKSTPLLALEKAISDADISKMLVAIFNDQNIENSQNLQREIDSISNIDVLSNKPQVWNTTVGEEIVKIFETISLIPTLFFIDPWGYKGLSLRLIGSVIKNWGCDCIFFFNYNRINMALNNSSVEEHMNSLFSKERADKLRLQIKKMQPEEREYTIIQEICQALTTVKGSYVQDFCLKNASGSRTSHYLIFVSKHQRGHAIMKEIMAQKSSVFEQGVPSFKYNPAPIQLSLFDSQPLDQLEDILLDEFADQTITMLEIYERHHLGKRYIKKNYKDALLKLEAQGKIMTNPSKRIKNTMGDSVEITFPPKQ